MPLSDPFLLELDRIVREGGKIAQDSRNDLGREFKPDGSLVTNGDRLVETFFRKELPQLIDAPIWGEEFGFAEEGAGGLWTVDPIDGTTNFSFGSPLWGVTLAHLAGDAVEFGAVFLPDLGEMYIAARGKGAFLNGIALDPIPPGEVHRYETISMSDTLLKGFPNRTWPGKMRCSGAFVVEAAFVATQRFRGMIGFREKLYDVAGSICLGLELGAEVRYASGSALSMFELKQDKQIEEPWLIFPRKSGFVFEA